MKTHNYTARTNDKHDVKNDHYHVGGGSSAAGFRNFVTDFDVYRQSGISRDSNCLKDFTSEKKV